MNESIKPSEAKEKDQTALLKFLAEKGMGWERGKDYNVINGEVNLSWRGIFNPLTSLSDAHELGEKVREQVEAERKEWYGWQLVLQQGGTWIAILSNEKETYGANVDSTLSAAITYACKDALERLDKTI